MESTPLVSIIVPVYNVETYLPVCIDSILQQTYQNFELILINDGSTDSSGRICNDYAQKDERIRVFHQLNKGLSGARNTGLANAGGEFVTFIDSDDYVDDNYLAEFMEARQNFDSDIIISLYNQYDEVAAEWKFLHYPDSTGTVKQVSKQMIVNEIFSRRYYISFSSAWGKLFKRSLFDIIRFPEGRVFEDGQTLIQLYLYTDKITLVEKATYWYRIGRESITNSKMTLKKYDDLFYSFKQFCQYLTLSGLDLTSYCQGGLPALRGLAEQMASDGFDYTETYREIQVFISILEQNKK